MGAEIGAELAGSQRWAAFLTYAHDDNAEYVKNFYEVFTKALKSHEFTSQIFLDGSHSNKYGDVKDYYRKRVSQADFLIIFVGNHYAQRPFCLFEWNAFRAQFQNKIEAQERLCIIEIDKDAIARLRSNVREPTAKERAAEIADSFHEKRLIKDGQRILSEISGRLNEEFEEIVKTIAFSFVKKYRELQNDAPVRAAPPRDPIVPTPDAVAEEIDVLIAASTPDLDSAIAELQDELISGKLTTQRIDAQALPDLTDSELRDQLQVGRWLVQPFSWHRVTNARTRGGHLVRQASLFQRPERALFWRPKGVLDEAAAGDLTAKVERRPEHVETLQALHCGQSPVAGHHGVVFGEAADVVDRIKPPDAPPSRLPARIVWEFEPEIADRLELALQFTEERCVELSPDFRVRNIMFALQEIIAEMSDWPKKMHGVVLADYAKSASELWTNINAVYDHLDNTHREIPIMVFVMDRETPRVERPPSIFFRLQEQPRRVVVEKQLDKFDWFLRQACAIARSESAVPEKASE